MASTLKTTRPSNKKLKQLGQAYEASDSKARTPKHNTIFKASKQILSDTITTKKKPSNPSLCS